MRARPGLLAALLVTLAAAVLGREQRLAGDGGEYLMMALAWAHHASPVLSPEDFRQLVAQPWSWLGSWNAPAETYQTLLSKLGTPAPTSWAGYAWSDGRHIHAIHFWLLSLFAAPFAGPLAAMHANPLWSLLLVNLGCVLLVAHRLARQLPDWADAGLLAFFVSGTSFYLAWTGTEVMSAACVLLSVLAALRGAVGAAMLAAGIGAAQTPSLLALLPLAPFLQLVRLRWAAWLPPGPPVRAWSRRDYAGAVTGIVLGMLPFVWFQIMIGVPSIPGKYATVPEWLSWNRLHSLYFDLSQGMLVCLPGVGLAFVLSLLLVRREARRASWTWSGLMLALMLVMSVPQATALNWNSGAVVVARYAYWLAMPLLAAVLLALPQMTRARAWCVLGVLFAAQAVVLRAEGWYGQKGDYAHHGALAQRVLARAPAWYNPDPEIFYERSGHGDGNVPINEDAFAVWRVDGHLRKLLRHSSQTSGPAGLCPPGFRLEGSAVRRVDRGWEYLHAPFHCERGQQSEVVQCWHFAQGDPSGQPLLGSGWSLMEGEGIWSEGPRSLLTLPELAPGGHYRLHLRGVYYGDQRSSEVLINGRALGSFALSEASINLPDDLRGPLHLELRHPRAQSPKARGESADGRLLGLYLRSLTLERLPPPERREFLDLSQ
ncbi:hypothetical protein [Massilia sp. TS11]|uniref:hypothetical protein n=1 Tax=Massilia sp. TS11 TaxID=2908003 RepID=UPI001EDC4B87|nr:hypothetical protein [Massilia sp. TS11]MCG2585927.1 hypothetical protein [Massilia sp. TS11]